MNPSKVLEYLNNTFFLVQEKYENINIQILKSAMIYQYIYFCEFQDYITIEKILVEQHGEIGLIGPANGCCTSILEKLFGKFKCCHMHSAFHKAYGRFYSKYRRGRGYCYVLKRTPKWIKKSPIFGHLTGFIWSMFNSNKF